MGVLGAMENVICFHRSEEKKHSVSLCKQEEMRDVCHFPPEQFGICKSFTTVVPVYVVAFCEVSVEGFNIVSVAIVFG